MAGEQQIDDLLAGILVEISGRLVGDEDRRIGRQRARDRDALLLAAGQLGRIVMQPFAKADAGELLARAFLRVGDAGQLQRHRDVFQRRHGRDQVERLEHDADMAAAEARQRVFVERVQIFAGHRDRAGVGALQPGHHHQQRGFARAGRADEANCLAAAYIQVDVFEDMDAGRPLPEREIDAGKRDRRAASEGAFMWFYRSRPRSYGAKPGRVQRLAALAAGRAALRAAARRPRRRRGR